MSKTLALLTALLLCCLVLLAPRQYSSAQAGTDTATEIATESSEGLIIATEPVIPIKDSLTLDTNFSDNETVNPKLSVKLRTPVLTSATTAAAKGFNKAADDIVQGIAKSFKDDYGQLEANATLPPEIAALGSYVDAYYDVRIATPTLISIKFNVAWYGAGAAHPNTYSITLNYDLSTGKILTLADLFKPNANYIQALSDFSTKALQDAGKLDFPDGAAPKAENYQSWNITKDGLQINFDDYQVTSHAVGPQIVVIPYSALTTIIRANGVLTQFQ